MKNTKTKAKKHREYLIAVIYLNNESETRKKRHNESLTSKICKVITTRIPLKNHNI